MIRMITIPTILLTASTAYGQFEIFDEPAQPFQNGMIELPGGDTDGQSDGESQSEEKEDPRKFGAAKNRTAEQEQERRERAGELEPYRFPQPHMFERPMYVGPGQLGHYRGYWQPGGYDRRPGSPFFNSVPDAPPRGPLAGNGPHGNGYATGQSPYGQPANQFPGNQTASGYPEQGQHGNHAYNSAVSPYAGYGYGSPYGGYGRSVGPQGPGGDPYSYHFGPGYYRNSEYGHFRFPYYSYRRPWYFPGFAGWNRDTNIPW